MTTLQLASYVTTVKNPEPLYRLHRDTCPRLTSAIIECIENADLAPSRKILKATACSRCKPTTASLEEALTQSEAHETFRTQMDADQHEANTSWDTPITDDKPEPEKHETPTLSVFAGPAATLDEHGHVLPIRKGAYPETIDAMLTCFTCHTDKHSKAFPFVTKKGAGKGRLLECSKCWTDRISTNAALRKEGKTPVPAPRALLNTTA